MRYLLDTHTFLWFVAADPQLGINARNAIVDPKNDILLSIASPWEIAVKVSLGKLALRDPFPSFMAREITANRFTVLAIGLDHLAAVATLAMHHRDPFDRLLIAQALVEGMPILSADQAFDSYGVMRVW